jgi:hypothetical protein
MKLRFLLALIAVLGWPANSPAQSNDQTELIKTLVARIEQLERRVAELEGPARLRWPPGRSMRTCRQRPSTAPKARKPTRR